MIDELLKELRTAVDGAGGLSESAKAELLSHVGAMEACAATSGSSDDSGSPAGAGDSGTTGEKHALSQPLEGLVTSIEGFEASHPAITALVNRIATTLGNMGI